jgi:exodeoxyribonuclease VII large subunit
MEIKKLLENKIFTVSEFNEFLNSVLAPMSVVVEGEISDFRVSQNKFVWFNLKDEKESLNCFSMVFRIHQPLEDGMKVKIFGYPKIYGKSGRFSFIVESLELTGEGSLKRAFELLRAKLEKEGLFDSARKRPLPAFPQTIGLITSKGAAAYTDFLKQLQLRLGGLNIVFVPAAVQGAAAIPEVCAAFDYFNRSKARPDVIVLTRGGGSLEDLQEFNSEEIARAVFSSAVPVICAIGHERDITLAELVADARASTPTHAAQLAVPDRKELRTRLKGLLDEQVHLLTAQISGREHRAKRLIMELSETIGLKIFKFKNFFQALVNTQNFLAARLRSYRQHVEALRQLLLSLSPQAVLARGYSIVRKNGKIVRSSQELNVGEEVEVQPQKGRFCSRITAIPHD